MKFRLPKLPLQPKRPFVLLFFGVLLLALLPLAYFQTRNPSDARAGWFNDHYGYRQRFSFTHNAAIGAPRSITVTLDTAELITDGVMQADCDDTRFTDANGKELEFDLTGSCNNASTTYEVIFPSIINGTQYAYVYYSNPNAQNAEIDSTQYTALTPSGGDPSAITTRTNEDQSPGPVAYWSFDEGQDNTCTGGTNDACDSSGNGHDGTRNNDTNWETEDKCISGKCVSFDGDGDFINFGDKDVFSANFSGELSVSAWVKLNNLDTRQTPVSKGSSSNFEWDIRLDTDGTATAWIYTSAGGTVVSTSSTSGLIVPNKWYHVAFTYTNSSKTLNFYLNGNLIDQSTGSGTYTNGGANLQIGERSNTGSGDVDGYIDEVKIYPYVRTAAEIKQDYALGAGTVLGSQDQSFLSDGLLAYWPLDETSGTTFADASGNGYTATLTNDQETGTATSDANTTFSILRDDGGGTLSSTDDVYIGMILYIIDDVGCGLSSDEQRYIIDYDGTNKDITVDRNFSADLDGCDYQIRHQVNGKFGYGLFADGVNSALSSSIPTNTTIEGEITMSVWLYLRSNTVGQIFKNWWSPGGSFRGLISSGSLTMQFTDDADTVVYSVATTLPTSEWVHITVTGDKNAIKLYKNGELQDTDTPTASILNCTVCTNLPLFLGSGADSLDGIVDEMRIYNRSFSAKEVRGLYSWAPGPITYYNFEQGSGTTTLTDVSENGYDGTLGGSMTEDDWTTGKYGKSLEFDGVDDDVNIDTAAAALSYKQGTISTWVYRDFTDDGTSRVVTYFGSNSSNTIGFDYDFYGANTFNFGYIADGSGTVINVDESLVPNGQWSHLAFTWDQKFNEAKAYVNGVLQGTSNTNDGYFYPGSFTGDIGTDTAVSGGDEPWQGKIDEYKLYDYARTQEQILQDMQGFDSPIGTSQLPQPIAHWAFDEMQGSTANNSIDGQVNGTITNAEWTDAESCKVNGCLYFDSNGDYVTLGDNYDQGTNNYSLTGWFKTNETTADMFIINKGNPTAGAAGYGYSIRVPNTWGEPVPIFFTEADGSAADTASVDDVTFRDNVWHHFSATRSNSALKLYLDGKLVASDTSVNAANIDTADSLFLGAFSSGAGSLRGYLDEIKIYNVALTPEQVAQDMSADSAISFGSTGNSKKSLVSGTWTPPVGYWNFDDNGGTTANDLSGNDNTGTLSGMNDQDWVAGKVGRALEFDGVNDYVSFTNTSNYYGTDTLSLSGWFKLNELPSSAGNNAWITYNNHDTSPWFAWQVYVNNSDDKLYMELNDTADAAVSANNGSALSVNTWYHYAATYNAGDITLYLNGSDVTTDESGTATTNIKAADGPVFLGGLGSAATSITLDDFKIWGAELSQAQVAYEYNQGKPIAHWQFDECQGSTAHDASGNGNDGTINPGASGNTAVGTCNSGTSTEMWNNGTTGKFNASLDFDGTNDYVNIYSSALNTAFDPKHGSISLFAKVASSGNWTDSTVRDLINLRSDISNYIRIGKSNTNNSLGFLYSAGGTIDTLFTSGNSDTDWMHIVMTWDKDNDLISYYLNGTLIGTDNTLGTWSGSLSSSGTTIGSYSTAPITMWDGQIDDVQIFNYALSADQVKQLYNGGAVSFQ